MSAEMPSTQAGAEVKMGEGSSSITTLLQLFGMMFSQTRGSMRTLILTNEHSSFLFFALPCALRWPLLFLSECINLRDLQVRPAFGTPAVGRGSPRIVCLLVSKLLMLTIM